MRVYGLTTARCRNLHRRQESYRRRADCGVCARPCRIRASRTRRRKSSAINSCSVFGAGISAANRHTWQASSTRPSAAESMPAPHGADPQRLARQLAGLG